MQKILITLSVIIIILSGSSYADIDLHFLDVGQGDCTIVVADGEAMIIDGGSASNSDLVYSYIRNTLKLDNLKYMVATHPHDDHIGGLPAALKAVPVDIILSPVLAWNTQEFMDLLAYADIRESIIEIPADGDTYKLGDGYFTVLMCWPEAEYYTTVNDMSIILKIKYGNTSYIFTGDAEAYVEYTLVDKGDIDADVLKIGHHGSTTSSTLEFLQAVSPSISIISCGKNNKYGHPRQETLDKLYNIDSMLYRTDKHGTIIIHSDGKEITVKTEHTPPVDEIYKAPGERLKLPDGYYIGNSKTMKFHKPECKWVSSIDESSRIIFVTRENAILSNYIPCGNCLP